MLRESYNMQPTWVGRVANNPQLSSGLVLDLDARYGLTLVGADVSAWADGAGAANNFSEATNRPVYTASDANWGARPSIAYTSGNSDRLSSADAASTWAFLHDGTGMSIGMVFRPVSASPSTAFLFDTCNLGGGVVGVAAFFDGVSKRPVLAVQNGTTGAGAGTNPVNTTPLGVRASVVWTYSAASGRTIYVNGILVASDNSAFTPSVAAPQYTARIGMANTFGAFSGDINAVHVWTRYFTAADAALFHVWAKQNWGL